VIAHCDNTAVVSVLNSRYSQDKMLMQMLRGLNPCMYKKILAVVHLVPLACTPGYYGKSRGKG